ncbi:Uncharacterised protein [Candidatus Bilamarchaeum dharawalense]|uniref:Uncharacterized protein n=1 Tax=Candidatus Bilamarchaeum dharawalense TaxID=2885759 RepID=A0A5E4LR34_9ARCH|nr:Uncharacterised protein [Candidatus Bilamarchaeum dharawalense]
MKHTIRRLALPVVVIATMTLPHADFSGWFRDTRAQPNIVTTVIPTPTSKLVADETRKFPNEHETIRGRIGAKRFFGSEDRVSFDKNYDAIVKILGKLDQNDRAQLTRMFDLEDFSPDFVGRLVDFEPKPKKNCVRFVDGKGTSYELWANQETEKAALIVRDKTTVRIVGRSGNEFLITPQKNGIHGIEFRDSTGHVVATTKVKSHLSQGKVLSDFVFLSKVDLDEFKVLELALKYGVRPARVFAFLNGQINPWDSYLAQVEIDTVKASIMAAERTNLPPWFITAVAFQEGLAGNFEYLATDQTGQGVSSFYDVGAEAFLGEVASIKRFLPPDLSFRRAEPVVNEAGGRYTSVYFKDIPTTVEAIGGILAGRRERFLRFVKDEYGETTLTEQMLLGGTYYMYNAAHPRKLMGQKIAAGGFALLEAPYTGMAPDHERPTIFIAALNNARVLATTEFLKYKWGTILTVIASGDSK